MSFKVVGQFITNLFRTFILAEEPKLERKMLSENESACKLDEKAFNVYKSTQTTFKE